MGIIHYFLGDEDKRAQFIFNLIAPVYGMIDNASSDDFKRMAALLNNNIPLKQKSVLDVGTGTGSWIAALTDYHLAQAVGVDMSPKMIVQAKKKHPHIEFRLQHGANLKDFKDNSFDMVTATFVLHGMKREKRAAVIGEMKRVAREKVVIHDFYNNRSVAVQILEFLERSDFKYFQKHFKEEIQTFFKETTLIKGDNGNALYVGFVTEK